MRLLAGVAIGAIFVVACSGSERARAGFDDPDGGDDTPVDAGPRFSSSKRKDAGGAQCATAEAEAKKAPVDVILSVDQSGSMSDDLANVKANINKLSQFLQATGLDYRVIMIGEPGTGAYQICVPPPLGGPGCASNGTTYKSVPRHIESNDTLSIISETLDEPVGGTYEWRSFLRADSVKAFVPITDDNAYETASSFDATLLAKPGGLFGTTAHRQYVFYPIDGAAAYPSTSTCGYNAVNNGQTYLDLAKLTGGKWFPICNTDFGPVFQEIAKNVAAQVACELPIPKPTNGATIDLDKVNVTVTPSTGGAPEEILQDRSGACDATANGWQYDATKTKILLCGAACTSVQNDPGSKVSVQFGCETHVK